MTKVCIFYIYNSWLDILLIFFFETEEPLFFKILSGFSAYTNTKRIFDISNNSEGKLDCLDGIRSLSISWVIMGHSYGFFMSIAGKFNIYCRIFWFIKKQD